VASDSLVVEIWSDVACPFCWLGKRRFEKGLRGFSRPDLIAVAWKSFQLNPQLGAVPAFSVHDHIARKYGMDRADARAMNARLAEAGRREGLAYDFDRIVVTNTFDAHRLLQMARTAGIQDDAEERLFRAYFAEGKNLADRDVLADLGVEVGLERDAVVAALVGSAYQDRVRSDIAEARVLGIDGVPCFVIDRRYAVTGAQEPEVFTGALERALEERAGV
jgi:predicted DsbA family dithiol-disulfide isomerase